MTPDVSVIVPIYNAVSTLEDCARSIIAQSRDSLGVEVWLVDDGSTDGSGELADEIAAAHENVHAFHQSNSGWAGSPRNRGIERARGRYLFFVDADDSLEEGALAEMVAFADTHGSEVLVPRIRAEGRRKIHEDVFAQTLADAPIGTLVRSALPFMLVNRELSERVGLRFPENGTRLEDGIYCFTAYAAARRVSILADREYYVLRYREDASNISTSAISPPNHIVGVRRSIEALVDGPWPEAERVAAQEEFFTRVVLNRYSKKFADRSDNNKIQWVASNAQISHLIDGVTLSQANRAKLYGLRTENTQAMLATARHKAGLLAFSSVDGARSVGGGLELTGEVHPALGFGEIEEVSLEFSPPKEAPALEVPAQTVPLGFEPLLGTYGMRFTAHVGIRELIDLPESYLHVRVTSPEGTVTRSRVFAHTTHVTTTPVARVLIGATRFGGATARRELVAAALRRNAAPFIRRVRPVTQRILAAVRP